MNGFDAVHCTSYGRRCRLHRLLGEGERINSMWVVCTPKAQVQTIAGTDKNGTAQHFLGDTPSLQWVVTTKQLSSLRFDMWSTFPGVSLKVL